MSDARAGKAGTIAEVYDLHRKITQYFNKRLDALLDPENEEASYLITAADIGLIVKFIKDNEVSADPGDATQTGALRAKLTQLGKSGSSGLRAMVADAQADVQGGLH
ncbi:hypothetical protein Axy09_042 [Achromobacter phage vB_AxyP_19-32_Axy09]|uniref:Terminase small subunit n=1 Tax=Achromobacter phage vB_AxyP_19-32_Axy09 TaxID=2591040 RepID=A0A514CTU8_9CAUD|nr:hypothetical protein Axy09_042 [Achromobacter phage vB_AxyP_19-32_Axy09]